MNKLLTFAGCGEDHLRRCLGGARIEAGTRSAASWARPPERSPHSVQVIGSPFSARTFAAAFRQLNWPSCPLVSGFPFAFAFALVLVLLLSLMIHLRFRWKLPSSGRARYGP